ncbi:MAG: hypothetical protein ACRCTC_03975, partial [Cetobacterium sp.]
DDGRIKEVYIISISDHFYQNIIQKGYMVYNSKILLDISTSTARTIYMLIEKLRFENIYLKLDTIFLIKRIPLKYDKKNLNSTIKTLEKAFGELKNKKLIENFKFLKESTWEKSEIEIFFGEDSNKNKQERFFEDFNDFRSISTAMTISGTEHEIIDQDKQESKFDILDTTSEIVQKLEIEDITIEMVREIFDILPNVAKNLKSMPKTIQDSILKYGFTSVKSAAIYLSKQKNLKSPRAYFLKSLEKKWYKDIAEVIQKPKKTILEPVQIILEDNMHFENTFSDFEKLDEKVKNKIESDAYKEYISRCGVETKVQKLAFLAGKKSIITEFLIKNPKVLSENNSLILDLEIKEAEVIQELKTFEKTPLNDIQKLNEFINTTIDVYKTVLNLSDEKILKIKKEVVNELIEKFVNSTLTLEDIKSIIYTKVI